MIRPFCVTLSALSLCAKSLVRRMSHDTPVDIFEQPFSPAGASYFRKVRESLPQTLVHQSVLTRACYGQQKQPAHDAEVLVKIEQIRVPL